MRWDFLFDVLYQLKFPPKFVYWIKACVSSYRFSVKVNGALCGYFKGAKGLRQGDPLSPYLFVIVMEFLTLLIEDRIKRLPFKFHWRTAISRITSLSFADDLMLFCYGDLSSVSTLASSLNIFSELSGLSPNPSKSQCYLANVDSVETSRILGMLNFPRGYTPAKFLGVPLISSKLSIAHCRPLIDRITSRISSWQTKMLSFSGRIQLVRSVLFAIQAYWSSFFILPSSVLKSIKSVMLQFVWKGSSLQSLGAKVAWDKLALPFAEGGLNIKQLDEWNTAAILLHVWNVANPHSTSLWAKWIKNTVLKDKNFWCIPIPSDCSWIWKKVLKLRRTAMGHINYSIGDGSLTSLWFDPWINHNSIAQSARDFLVSNSGLGPNASVAAILGSMGWNLPTSNHTSVINFRAAFDYSRAYNLSKQDLLLWDSSSEVSIGVIWKSIRRRGQEVDWGGLVWHKFSVPRFSCSLWLAFHKGYKTKDVLLRYGIDTEASCQFCTQPESFSHLFFRCNFAFRVLYYVMRYCGWMGFQRDWAPVIAFVNMPRHSKFKRLILSLGISAVVHYLWRERNSRLHAESSKSPDCLGREIVHIIKCKLHSIFWFRKLAVRHCYGHLVLNA